MKNIPVALVGLLLVFILLLSGCASQSPVTITVSSPPTTVTTTAMTVATVPVTTTVTATVATTVKATTTVTATPTSPAQPTTSILTTPASLPQILITYSYSTVAQMGSGTFADTPDPGDIYLILNMTIENQGYASVDLYPEFDAYVVINNVRYSPAFVVNLQNELSGDVGLFNGGKKSGNLAFEIPANSTSFGTYYDPGFNDYNIVWVKQ